jgi:D-beta-D-heptose 7-phosphate kinase/D-beta-D-heptose 1-phosphate adenosyltransferase
MARPTSSPIANLKRIIPRIKGKRIGVLGDLMLDRYLWGTASRLSPESPVPVVEFEKQEQFLGGAGNVAANLAALGVRAEAFGVIGEAKNEEDEAGRSLRACLRELGIGDRGVVADPARVTTVKTRIIARHQQIVRLDQESRETLGKEVEDRIFRKFAERVKNLDGLVFSDYDKGVVSDSLSERVLSQCHKEKIPVFVGPKRRHLLAHRGARAVICNLSEAEGFVTHPLRDEKAIEEAGRALLAHFGCGAVIITRGERGMSILEEASPKYLTISATAGKQVFDVTGAGDTVLSVLAAAVCAGASVPDAATLANTAAGVVVGKLGTASVSPEELIQALDDLAQ